MAAGRYVLFSQVNAVVHLGGTPVAGATVERTCFWRWAKLRYDDAAVTDAQGRFSLPVITGRSMTAWLPHDPFVEQGIVIRHDGKRYAVWGHNRRSYENNSELSGKPIQLRIELSMDAKT